MINPIKELKKVTQQIEHLEDLFDIKSDEDLKNAISYVVETYAINKMVPSAYLGSLRNHAVQVICEQLNELTYDHVFQDDFKVVYKAVESPGYTTLKHEVCD